MVRRGGTVEEAIDEAGAHAAGRGGDGHPPRRRQRHRGDPRDPRQPPETQVLMLTSFADDEALYASIMAGASGYVLKQIGPATWCAGSGRSGAGESLLDPSMTSAVLDRLRRGKHLLKDERLALLSPQEEKILGLVAEGKTNRPDRRRSAPGREDGQELRQQHPVQTRSGPPIRSGRLSGPPHHHARQRSSSSAPQTEGSGPTAGQVPARKGRPAGAATPHNMLRSWTGRRRWERCRRRGK